MRRVASFIVYCFVVVVVVGCVGVAGRGPRIDLYNSPTKWPVARALCATARRHRDTAKYNAHAQRSPLALTAQTNTHTHAQASSPSV